MQLRDDCKLVDVRIEGRSIAPVGRDTNVRRSGRAGGRTALTALASVEALRTWRRHCRGASIVRRHGARRRLPALLPEAHDASTERPGDFRDSGFPLPAKYLAHSPVTRYIVIHVTGSREAAQPDAPWGDRVLRPLSSA